MEIVHENHLTKTKSRLALPANLPARVVWECKRLWRRMGWSLFLTAIFVVVAGFIFNEENALLRHQIDVQEKLKAVRSSALNQPVVDSRQSDAMRQIENFYAYLPTNDMIPDQLKRLMKLARKSGVTLSQADYKTQLAMNAEFLRYQIAFPVKAPYPNIQKFIIEALYELPTLALDSVVLKRDRVELQDVEARVQFTLIVKKPPPERNTP